MMNSLMDHYCPVCREQAVLAIYGQIPRLLVASDPPEGAVEVPEAGQTFTVTPLGPDTGLDLSWWLDGGEVGAGATLDLPGCGPSGTLVLEARDGTPWVRSDPDALLEDRREWSITRAACPEDTGETGDAPPPPPDCGCAASPVPAALPLPLLLPFLARRRKQAR